MVLYLLGLVFVGHAPSKRNLKSSIKRQSLRKQYFVVLKLSSKVNFLFISSWQHWLWLLVSLTIMRTSNSHSTTSNTTSMIMLDGPRLQYPSWFLGGGAPAVLEKLVVLQESTKTTFSFTPLSYHDPAGTHNPGWGTPPHSAGLAFQQCSISSSFVFGSLLLVIFLPFHDFFISGRRFWAWYVLVFRREELSETLIVHMHLFELIHSLNGRWLARRRSASLNGVNTISFPPL